MAESTGGLRDLDTEVTPLLKPIRKPMGKRKRSFHLYGVTFGMLFLLFMGIQWYRNILPTALSDSEAHKLNEFSGIHAYNEYLSQFIAPHSVNSRENGKMRDWIFSVVEGLKREGEKHEVVMDIDTPAPKDIISSNWTGNDEFWIVESRNVIARLHGASKPEDALLINAHYDSVPTSNGVTDNGMGVSTALELVRYFIHHPPKHTIIFLFNNFEEGGLIGAESFTRHPWFSSVKLFINLEGAGAGGRSILFRCSNLNAMKHVSNSGASYMHSSPLGNDMFKAQLIKSDTDYTVFTQNNIPGIDIAFYAPRSLYHTTRDDLAHTTPNALQYMGQFALASARSIINNDDLLTTGNEQELMIYYDILGRLMLVYSFSTYQIVNVVTIIAVASISFYMMVSYNQNGTPFVTLLKRRSFLLWQGLLSVLSALFISLLFAVIAGFTMTKLNPFLTYGAIHVAFLYMFSAVFLGLQVSQLILPQNVRVSLSSTNASWYGLITFWTILVLLSCWAGSYRIASLYFAVYLLACSALAAIIHVILPDTRKFRSPVIFMVQMIVPFIFLIEISMLIMDAMRHTTVDGTPEIIVYILLAIPIILIILNYLPWVYVAQNQHQISLISAGIFLFFMIISSVLLPFNGEKSPNKIYFKQDYNVSDTLSTVTVVAGNRLQTLLKTSLPEDVYESITCDTLNGNLIKCRFQSNLLPVYASNTTLNEFVLSDIHKDCNETSCSIYGHYHSKNSLMCRTSFETTTNRTVQRAWINGEYVESKNISAIVTYVDKYEQPVPFRFEYPASEHSLKAYFSCFYDEWTHLELPAFSYLRNNLPENAVIVIRGQGLAYVQYAALDL